MGAKQKLRPVCLEFPAHPIFPSGRRSLRQKVENMLIKNIFLLAALFLTNPVHGQAPFQNLDFESATVPDIPQGTSGSEVSVNEALPSWTISSGQEPVLLVFHNQVAS